MTYWERPKPLDEPLSFSRRAALLGVASLVAAACSPRHLARRTIRLGYLPIAECTPLFVGQALGLFQRRGLNVELKEFQDGPTVISAAQGGSLDGGLSGVAPIFFALEKDINIKLVGDGGHVVAAPHPYVGLVVGSNSPIKLPSELKGKTVAVNGLKTIEEALLRVALAKAGIAGTVKVVELPHPTMVQALESGIIDASMAIEPYISMGLGEGKIRILEGSEDIIPSFQISAIFFTELFLSNHGDDLLLFSGAYNDAIDFIDKNPAQAKTIVSQWTGTPIATSNQMTLPGWDKQLSIARLDAAKTAMLSNHIIDTDITLQKYVL